MGAALAPYNAGMTFGPYHVTAKIGEGGMGRCIGRHEWV